MGVSLGEILIVLVVMLFALDVRDVRTIIRKFFEFKKYVTSTYENLRDEYSGEIMRAVGIEDKESGFIDDIHDINYYIKSIVDVEGKYSGGYTLDSAREEYYAMMKRVGMKELTSTSTNGESVNNTEVEMARMRQSRSFKEDSERNV